MSDRRRGKGRLIIYNKTKGGCWFSDGDTITVTRQNRSGGKKDLGQISVKDDHKALDHDPDIYLIKIKCKNWPNFGAAYYMPIVGNQDVHIYIVQGKDRPELWPQAREGGGIN